MGRYTNAFYRISGLMSLIMSDRFTDGEGDPGLSLDMVSDMTGIPLKVLQNDMFCLCKDKRVYNALKVGKYDSGSDSCDGKKDQWLKALSRGEKSAFSAGIGLSAADFSGQEEGEAFLVDLSPFEKNVFAKFSNLSRASKAIWIKEPVFAEVAKEERFLGRIQIAIEQNHPISFKYLSDKGESICDRFCARCIYEMLDNGVRYCVGVREDSKFSLRRLDRISELRVHEDEQMPPLKSGALDKLDYIWGSDSSPDEPVHVKVKIYKETKNIYEKIKTETNGRKYRKLYDDPEDPGIAYYEDEVWGLNSFKKWLRGYGASVVALEPLSLAEEMYQSALRRLERYKELQ